MKKIFWLFFIILLLVIGVWLQGRRLILGTDKQRIVLVATGDVSLARTVNTQIQKRFDPTWPFLKTADYLKKADITLINLESPLVSNCPLTDTGMKFCGDIKNVEGLIFAGVDVASLANNHTKNYGEVGLKETKNVLAQNGILSTSQGEIAYKKVRKTTFAFVGYDDVSSRVTDLSNITTARQLADVVVISVHWGNEYTDKPSERQVLLGHQFIDAGADLVIGNHPHWVQPTETYKDKLIVYAHGNFVFDQEWSQKTKEGVVGEYIFENEKLISWQLYPILITNFGQPDWVVKY